MGEDLEELLIMTVVLVRYPVSEKHKIKMNGSMGFDAVSEFV